MIERGALLCVQEQTVNMKSICATKVRRGTIGTVKEVVHV